jgi:hypothetical protein
MVDHVRMIRPAHAAAALLAAALLAGCSAQHAVSAASTSPSASSASPSPSPSGVSLVDECASAISYWTGQALTPGPDQGYDYQEMGLSAAEYEILKAVILLARPVARQSGVPAAQTFAQRTATPRCAAYLASASAAPSASGKGWPQ